MFQRSTAALTCLFLVISISACIHPYKSPISQGNLLRNEDIERLETGMTREQVVFLIGQPILAQPFEKARWDYIYISRSGYLDPVRHNLTLYFDDDRLIRIENQYRDAKPEEIPVLPDSDPEG